VLYLCPSCSQKRTLLFGEHMNEHLLLLLPHRQMVFTFPKVLRVFFRHDRRLYGEISKLVYRMIRSFYTAAAGRRIHSAVVIAYAGYSRSWWIGIGKGHTLRTLTWQTTDTEGGVYAREEVYAS
jgi:hypothetical protein